jgi:hypothetical protein
MSLSNAAASCERRSFYTITAMYSTAIVLALPGREELGRLPDAWGMRTDVTVDIALLVWILRRREPIEPMSDA